MTSNNHTISFAIVLIMIAIFTIGAATGQTEPPSSGDWEISDTTVIENEAIDLRGDLIVKNGGNLELRNVTLTLKCTRSGEFGVWIEPGGSLTINAGSGEGSIIKSYTKTHPYTMVFENGSDIHFSDTRVQNCGFDDPVLENNGPMVRTSGFILEGCEIRDNYYGLLIEDSSLGTLDDVSVSNSYRSGIFMDGASNITMTDLVLEGNYAGITISYGGDVSILGGTFNSTQKNCIFRYSNDILLENITFIDGDSDAELTHSDAVFNNVVYEEDRILVFAHSVLEVQNYVRFKVYTSVLKTVGRKDVDVVISSNGEEIISGKTKSGGGFGPVLVPLVIHEGNLETGHEIIATFDVEGWTYSEGDLDLGVNALNELFVKQGSPHTVEVLEGDGSLAVAGKWSGPIKVKVLDPIGEEVETGTVTFFIRPSGLLGDSSFSSEVVSKEWAVEVVNGVASVRFVLDSAAGNNKVECRLENNNYVGFNISGRELEPGLTFDQKARTGETIKFNAGSSRGDIAFYSFNFGDGQYSGKLTVPVSNHTYMDPGEYQVRLTLTMENDLSVQGNFTLTVTESAEKDEGLPVMNLIILTGVLVVVLLVVINTVYVRMCRKKVDQIGHGLRKNHAHLAKKRPPAGGAQVKKRRTGKQPAKRTVARPRTNAPPKGVKKDKWKPPSPDSDELAVRFFNKGTKIANSEPERAVGLFMKSLELDPEYSKAYYNLGVVLCVLERYDEAAGAFKRTLELDPDHRGAGDGLTACQTVLEDDPFMK